MESGNYDIEESNNKGKRPIHVAADMDNVEAVELLIHHGANVLSQQGCFFGLTAVHIAAAREAINVLNYLLTWSKEQGSLQSLTRVCFFQTNGIHSF